MCVFPFPTIVTAECVSVLVSGQSDPWLAGMPNGSPASACAAIADEAPAQSPVLVLGLQLRPGNRLTFVASGQTRPCTNASCNLPPSDANGDAGNTTSHVHAAQNGISDITAPISGLMGVFLAGDFPNASGAPSALDFGSSQSRDYVTLLPELKQVFFIGTGTNSFGQTHQVVVPPGATRLYLGVMDACNYWDNGGELTVTVADTATSPPVLTLVTPNELAFDGVLDRSYCVEFSTQLPALTWTPLTNTTLPCASFNMTNTPSAHSGFFRVVELP
jgi:hypothetical protein